LEYHKVDSYIDKNLYITKCRENIIKKIDIMLNRCIEIGENPFVVTVLTFSMHGISYKGDAIGVIPEK
jgi:hypothetical protein